MITKTILITFAGALTFVGAVHAAQQVDAKVEKAAKRNFDQSDTNGDGKLVEAEILTMLQGRAAKKGETEAVKPARAQRLLKRLDTNGDGAADLAEMIAHRMENRAKKSGGAATDAE